jgi:hypothetical protein
MAAVPSVTDPASRFEAALAQPEGEVRLASLRAAFAQWLLTAPVAAMNAAERIPFESREAVITVALAKLAEQKPTEALDVVGRITENYATYASAVLGVIATTDPRRALDWAALNADRDPRGEMMHAIVPVLARSNPDMAARAVVAMGDRAPTSLIQHVAAEYAMRAPLQAYAWARSVGGASSVADEVVNGVSASLAARDIDRAASLLKGAADPSIRASLIREIANRKSEADLHEAWTWLSQYSADASYPENARNLLYRWAYLRPDEVASLLDTVTDPEIRVAAARELALQWQRRDSGAYHAWLDAQPAGPMKSAMLSAAQ